MGRAWAAAPAAFAAVLALAFAPLDASAQAKPRPSASSAGTAKAPAKAAVPAVNYAERYAGLCAACHGANGRSDMPLTPVLAGQPSLYAITQLFLFREGRRNNPAMIAVAKTLSDDDLRGFSDYIGTLPPVPAPAPATPSDAKRMAKAQELAQQYKCVSCHGADLGGGQQVPRIAGQHEDYVQQSLRGFSAGTRPGYTQAMIGALSQVPVEDLDLLAYYVARFPVPPAGK